MSWSMRVRPDRIQENDRTHKAAKARALTTWLLYRQCRYTYTEIAKRVQRDRATLYYHVQKIDRAAKYDREMAFTVARALRMVEKTQRPLPSRQWPSSEVGSPTHGSEASVSEPLFGSSTPSPLRQRVNTP